MSSQNQYAKQHEKDYATLMEKYEELLAQNKQLKSLLSTMQNIERMLAELTESNKSLTKEIEEKNEFIKTLTEANLKLANEVERLRKIIDKDSSNSSKPSSGNGSKKVITNRREKSDKPKGGQKGHKPTKINMDLINNLKNNSNCIYSIEYDGKDYNNGYVSTYVVDIQVNILLKETRHYLDEKGNCAEKLLNPIQYGNNIKIISNLLMNDNYCSTDSTIRFIKNLTNNVINLSKGTLMNWQAELSNKLEPELNKIIEDLLNSHYTNNDDSQIKINGENCYQICASNKKSTMLWISKTKGKAAYEKIGFLRDYYGIIVKDGTSVYNEFKSEGLAQCGSHILRYLKGIYEAEGINRPEAKDLAEYLIKLNNDRNEAISNGIKEYSSDMIASIYSKYNELIEAWKKAYAKDNKSYIAEEEKRLLNRMSDKHKDEILFFVKDFKIPFTNNQAEVDQRPIKIKQKIGKFRSLIGAIIYTRIKSFILTIKKRGIDVLSSLVKILNEEPVLA